VIVRRHVWIRGRVQGVWFRQSARRVAEERGLSGWVRNLPDGRVEALVEGDAAQIEQALAFLRRGPRGAVVEHFELRDEPATGDLVGFEVWR
jgi:acylphosphatase